jgi:hypothetical protein
MNEIFSSTQHFVQNRAAGASRDNRVYQGNRNAASALGSVICLFQSKVSAIGREAPDLLIPRISRPEGPTRSIMCRPFGQRFGAFQDGWGLPHRPQLWSSKNISKRNRTNLMRLNREGDGIFQPGVKFAMRTKPQVVRPF